MRSTCLRCTLLLSLSVYSVFHFNRPQNDAQPVLLTKKPPKYDEGLEHEPDFLAILDGQLSKLGRSLLPFTATPGDEHAPFRDCIFFRKGIYRSAIAAVTPDGGTSYDAQPVLLTKKPPKYDEGLEHEPDFLAILDGQLSKLGRSLLPFTATPGDEHAPFRDCIFFKKGIYRSAIAAVTPDGGTSWMAAEDLQPPENWIAAVAQWLSAEKRGRECFPDAFWVHDGFQMLSGLSNAPTLVTTASTSRIWCCTPSGMVNGAQEKRAKKDTNTEHDWRGRQD